MDLVYIKYYESNNQHKKLCKRELINGEFSRGLSKKVIMKKPASHEAQEMASRFRDFSYAIIFAYFSFLKRTNRINQTVNLYE
jgi:hypothetical protein